MTELFKTDRGENMKLKFVMTDVSVNETPRKGPGKAKQKQRDAFIFHSYAHLKPMKSELSVVVFFSMNLSISTALHWMQVFI